MSVPDGLSTSAAPLPASNGSLVDIPLGFDGSQRFVEVDPPWPSPNQAALDSPDHSVDSDGLPGDVFADLSTFSSPSGSEPDLTVCADEELLDASTTSDAVPPLATEQHDLEVKADRLLRFHSFFESRVIYESLVSQLTSATDPPTPKQHVARVQMKLCYSVIRLGDFVLARLYLRQLLFLFRELRADVARIDWALRRYHEVISSLARGMAEIGDHSTANAYKTDDVKVQNMFEASERVFSSWMYKKGYIRKNWKKRFFSLYSNKVLKYFTSDGEYSQLRGIVNVREASWIRRCENPDPWKFGIDIRVHKRIWNLRLDDEHEWKSWMYHLTSGEFQADS